MHYNITCAGDVCDCKLFCIFIPWWPKPEFNSFLFFGMKQEWERRDKKKRWRRNEALKIYIIKPIRIALYDEFLPCWFICDINMSLLGGFWACCCCCCCCCGLNWENCLNETIAGSIDVQSEKLLPNPIHQNK